MNDTQKMIDECDRMTRDANMMAMKSDGWSKSVFLWWADVLIWLGDWGREIQRDEQRGKDDTYHDEY